MAKNIGNYYLIREDIENEIFEYFDFESMSFNNRVSNGVKISTIDALTTLFESSDELSDYIDKVENDNKYSYKIIYLNSRKNEEKVINVVWNDKMLSSLSKLADDKVDFANDNNYYLLHDIFFKVKDLKNGLAKRIITSKKESTRLSDNNKKIIEALATSKLNITVKDLMEVFSDYNECRALYLNYKINDENKNDFREQLQKIKQLLFEKE